MNSNDNVIVDGFGICVVLCQYDDSWIIGIHLKNRTSCHANGVQTSLL